MALVIFIIIDVFILGAMFGAFIMNLRWRSNVDVIGIKHCLGQYKVIPKSYYAEIAREHLKWDLKRDRGI